MEDIRINLPKIKETCEKCKYGLAIYPHALSCRYFKLKPYNIFYEGNSCPYFKRAITSKKDE